MRRVEPGLRSGRRANDAEGGFRTDERRGSGRLGGLTVPIHAGLRIGREPAAPSNGFNAVDAAHATGRRKQHSPYHDTPALEQHVQQLNPLTGSKRSHRVLREHPCGRTGQFTRWAVHLMPGGPPWGEPSPCTPPTKPRFPAAGTSPASGRTSNAHSSSRHGRPCRTALCAADTLQIYAL